MAAELENTAVDEDYKVNEIITCNAMGTWSRQADGTGSLSGSKILYTGQRHATAYSDIYCSSGHSQGPGSDPNSANGHNFTLVNP
jgi:hypothetical protein